MVVTDDTRIGNRFLYAIEEVLDDGHGGNIKVGYTQDMTMRHAALQSSNPRLLRIYGTAMCEMPERYERILKDVLRTCCIRGEWYTRDALEVLAHIAEPLFLAVLDGMADWGLTYEDAATLTRSMLSEKTKGTTPR